MKNCPRCLNEISENEVKCPFCEADLSTDAETERFNNKAEKRKKIKLNIFALIIGAFELAIILIIKAALWCKNLIVSTIKGEDTNSGRY